MAANINQQLAQELVDAVCLGQEEEQQQQQQHVYSVLAQCQELAECGALRRTLFVRQLADAVRTTPLQPLKVVLLASSCSQHGLFGLHLLQALLPEPACAAAVIHQAACSPPVVCGLLAHGVQPHGRPLTALLQLLEALLGATFDAAAAATADAGAASDVAMVQEYVAHVVEHLMAAAAAHEVLAVPLFLAAASRAILYDSEHVTRWMQQLLQQQLQACLQAAADLQHAAATGSRAAPAQPGHARHTAVRSWPALALQHRCWLLTMPAMLGQLQLQAVLSLVQDSLSMAAESAGGLGVLCDMLAALGACGQSRDVLDLLAAVLASAVSCSCSRNMVPPLLLAGQLLAAGACSKQEYAHLLQQAVTDGLANGGHAATALPALLKALNLLMLGSDGKALEAQVLLLRQVKLGSGVGPTWQAELHKGETMLADVLAQQQQLAKQHAEAQQGGRAVSPAEYAAYEQHLDSFMQQLPDAAGRRHLSPIVLGRWRMWAARGAGQAFAEAFTAQPPGSAERAAACLQYIQELQDHKLCRPGQAEEFRAACCACGLDPSSNPHQRQNQQQQQYGGAMHRAPAPSALGPAGAAGAAGHATAMLELLLSRLPAAVADAGSAQSLTILLGRITQHVQQILGPQQPQQPPPPLRRHSNTAEPPAKQAKMGPGAPGAPGPPVVQAHQLLGLLLSAYDAAAAASSFSGPDGGLDWRLAFVRMLQQLPALQPPLLARLLGSLQGSSWGPEEAPAQALRHGSLLALLAASELRQQQVLQPASDGSISQAPVLAGLFTWACSSNGGCSDGGGGTKSRGQAVSNAQPPPAAAAAAAAVGSLRGLQLVQVVLGNTATATVQQRCCAASFWAGYLGCIKKTTRQWCAGPWGPFGSTSTFSSSPAGTAATQATQSVLAAAGSGAAAGQVMLAYVPPQLAALLQQLVAELAQDARQQPLGAAAGAAGAAPAAQAPQAALVAGALQACTRALKVPAVKWVCDMYGL